MPTWPAPPNGVRPHPENMEGPFYVEDGCCITCGLPESEAPDIFGWSEQGEYSQCVVKRQPATSEELTQTLTAIWAGEVDCIRYRGDDPAIKTRLVEMGEGAQCDGPLPPRARPLVRSRVTFSVEPAHKLSAKDIAASFHAWLAAHERHYKVLPLAPFGIGSVKVRFAWHKLDFHTVGFRLEKGAGRAIAIISPSDYAAWGLGRTIASWLKEQTAFGDPRWYSEEQYRAGGPWRDTLA